MQIDSALLVFVGLVLGARVVFEVGSCYTMPIQLAFVPALFVVPPASREFRLGAGHFDLDPTTLTTQIQLRFTAMGPATAVLDDLYIDPSARR